MNRNITRRKWITSSTVVVFAALAVSFLMSGLSYADSLVEAAKGGDVTGVNQFPKGGTNPNVKDSDGVTALMYASEGGHLKVVELLLQKCANPNLREPATGMTALMV
jgi:ankyrin repeat protein